VFFRERIACGFVDLGVGQPSETVHLTMKLFRLATEEVKALAPIPKPLQVLRIENAMVLDVIAINVVSL